MNWYVAVVVLVFLAHARALARDFFDPDAVFDYAIRFIRERPAP